MSDKAYVGDAARSVEQSPVVTRVSKVILHKDEDTTYVSGDNTGRTIEGECSWATQEIADNLLNTLKDIDYQPYKATGAVLDPAAELGDGVTVGGVYGGIYTQEMDFDSACRSDLSAEQGSDIDHEIPYEPSQDRKTDRKINNVRSEITKTVNGITLAVYGTDGTTTFDLRSNGVTIDTSDVDLNVKSANVYGTFTADKIKGGTLEVGGINNQSGEISLLDEDGDSLGKINSDGISLNDPTALKEVFSVVRNRGAIITPEVTQNYWGSALLLKRIVDETGEEDTTIDISSAFGDIKASRSVTSRTINCQALNVDGERVKSFVIGSYEQNGWACEIYSSGKKVAVKTITHNEAIDTAYGALYRSQQLQDDMPTVFFTTVEQDIISVSGGCMLYVASGLSTTKSDQFYLVHPVSQSAKDYKVTHYVIGT